jgi:DNA-binding MarR family transcriptional regulator
VDRLERDGYVRRERASREKRKVEVEMTGAGKKLYRNLDRECSVFTARLLDALPAGRRRACIEALDMLTRAIEPENERFRETLRGCCGGGKVESGR